jgi:mRNA interferase HicA
MIGHELLRRLRRFARQRGISFRYDPRHGKGSHGRVWVGSRFTALPSPQRELPKGTLRSILADLGVEPREVE